MNKILKTFASASFDISSYEAPAMIVVEMGPKGVLCVSGDHEEWGTDDDLWS